MKHLGIALICGPVLLIGAAIVYPRWTNSRVIRELREDPHGERAKIWTQVRRAPA